MKFANFQCNKANKEILDQLYLVGSIDMSDLKDRCLNKDPVVPEER